MKFTNTLVALTLALSSVSAFPNNLFTRDTAAAKPTSQDCQKALDEIDTFCMVTDEPSRKMYEQSCRREQMDKCKDFWEFGIKNITQCQGLPEGAQKSLSSLIELYQQKHKFYCTRDEIDHECPLIKIDLNKREQDLIRDNEEELRKIAEENIVKDSSYDEAAKETCKSQRCHEVAYKYFDTSIKILSEIEDKTLALVHDDELPSTTSEVPKYVREKLNRFFDVIKTGECSKTSGYTPEKTSDAVSSSIKISSFVIATLSFTLFYLF